MRSTLLRYLLKRWMVPFLGALLFYGGMLMAYEVVGVTKQIFSVGAPFRWVGPLLLLSVPEDLGMVLPMAAVLGGLMGTRQLVEGSEWVASQGLGVGMRALVKPWALLSGCLIVLATLNANFVVPWANATQHYVQAQMIEEARTRFLKPGGSPWFPPRSPRNAVWIAPDGQIHLMEVSNDRVQHLVAERLKWGQSDKDFEHSEINLRLENIKGMTLHKPDAKVTLIQEMSHTYTIRVPAVPKLLPSTNGRYQSTSHLLGLRTPEAVIELSRRFTLPIATCALLLLGIALGLGHARFQKGGSMVKSLGVIVVYYLALKFFENQVLNGKVPGLPAQMMVFLLPFFFLAAGYILLVRRLHPHHSNRFGRLLPVRWVQNWLHQAPRALRMVRRVQVGLLRAARFARRFLPSGRSRTRAPRAVLRRWTGRLWWRSWGAVMGTFLALSFLIEYASLAGDMAHNHASIFLFLRYWIWNLPTFLAVVLPLAFLMGGVLALSDATMTREWVALRAGGTSFLQWARAGRRAWGAVMVLTFILQAYLGPFAFQRADTLYHQILGRPVQALKTRPSWLHLGSTGVVWFLDGDVRWGFPLKAPGPAAPVLLKWRIRAERSMALPWDSLGLLPGPPTADLFPSRALQESASADATPTLDLFQWQKWAPDPERATMIWSRLFGFLAGPILLFAMLPNAFPNPRGGRGQALGYSLVLGLVFMGLQALFSGAAKAGEFPAPLGALCPMLLLLGFGLMRLHRLRT